MKIKTKNSFDFSSRSKIKSIDEENLTITHYISTSAPDRYGEVMNPAGCDFSDYIKNPVVFFGHKSRELPIARNEKIIVDDSGVMAVTKFDTSDFAREVFRLNSEGFLNSWSIGFIPLEPPVMKDGFIHYNKWKLLEYSSVPIPANPEAVNLILKEINNNELKEFFLNKPLNKERNNKMNDDVKTSVDAEQKVQIKTKEDPLDEYRDSENKFNPELKDFRMFLKAIVYNRPELFPHKTKAGSLILNETTDAEGGYLVPQQWANKIYDNVGKYGVARRNATVLKMNRKQLLIPKLTTLPSFAFVNEMSPVPMSVPAFDQISLTRHDGGFITCFSRQLIEDEDFDLLGFVTNLASKIILKNEDSAAFRGLNPIVGILDPAMGVTPIETAGQQFDSISYDNIIDATVAIPSHNLSNSKWFMSRSVWGLIKKLKYGTESTGSEEYIVSPSDRQNMTLEGYPVELTEGCYSISESGRGLPFIAFGDLKNLVIGERKGLTIDFSREATVDDGLNKISLWQNGLIGLNFGVSFDMQLIFPDSMCVIKTAG